MAIDLAPRNGADGRRRRRRAVRLSVTDRVAIAVMVLHPDGGRRAASCGCPTFALRRCSRSRTGTASAASRAPTGSGTQNYRQLATINPPFWPAVEHNLIWLGFLAFVATPFGLLLAFQLDKEIRGSRIYQSIFYLPVVLSFAIIGFIWQLIYSPTQGLINNLFGNPGHGHVIDWLGNPEHQPVGDPRRRRLASRRLHHGALPGRAEGGRQVAARGRGDRRRERVALVPLGRSSRCCGRSTS